jgi:hypothetical protein
MQPYFFPYIGYFQLMDSVDEWIVFDDVQFARQGWASRNRILHPRIGWQYVIVALRKQPLSTLIRDVLLVDRIACRDRVLRQLEHYRNHAPEYETAMSLVEAGFDVDTDRVSELNVHAIETCCGFLSIDTTILRSSAIERPVASDAQTGVIELCRLRGIQTYVNLPGGRDLYDATTFRNAGVQLLFLAPGLVPYDQARPEFEPGLSIIDVVMWNPVETITSELMKYETVSAAENERCDA